MKNNMKKILSLLLALVLLAGMSAFAAEGDFTGDTMKNTTDLKAYYKVTHGSDYTDFSGVKLTWSVPVLKYTKTDVRTWNTTTLKWEQNYDYSNAQEVTFNLTNRGSYAVKANVSYTSIVTGASSVTFGIKDPNDASKTINENDPILASIVNTDYSLKAETEKETYVTNNCSATISGTVSLDASKLTDASGKLGTYTVTISDPSKHTVTVKYYKTAQDTQLTTETITVADGTAYSVDGDGDTITIGNKTFTTLASITDEGEELQFVGWFIGNEKFDSSNTVTADITITVKYGTTET